MTTDDPLAGRPPTSHERQAGRAWDASYQDGPAPWDIERAQPAVVRLASRGGFMGAVLDVGCGTGENALHVAALGLPVLGVDVAPTAVGMARAKAEERSVGAEFGVVDALALDRLRRSFATVLDCGLFHTFDGDERLRYVASLTSVAGPGATLYLLCFSDEGPDAGPHPVRREELSEAFASVDEWTIVSIVPDRISTRFHDERGAPAWLATIRRA